MLDRPRSMVHEKAGVEQLAEGLWLDRLQPGGWRGPQGQVLEPLPGGRVWTDMFHLGTQADPFILTVPDIRMPPNQLWPLHWHDCWIAVIILEGSCVIGDWVMGPGDILISAAELEYGPLLVGPEGCQLFEVFADLARSGGGYSPEYRDHPTLAGGVHAFRERSPVNQRNNGHSMLPVDGVEGLIKARLTPGGRWDLGAPGDPERGVMGYTALAAGETIAAHGYGDWHGLFVLEGSLRFMGRELPTGSVLIARPGVRLDAIEGGPQGARIFEAARTARGMERLA